MAVTRVWKCILFYIRQYISRTWEMMHAHIEWHGLSGCFSYVGVCAGSQSIISATLPSTGNFCSDTKWQTGKGHPWAEAFNSLSLWEQGGCPRCTSVHVCVHVLHCVRKRFISHTGEAGKGNRWRIITLLCVREHVHSLLSELHFYGQTSLSLERLSTPWCFFSSFVN